MAQESRESTSARDSGDRVAANLRGFGPIGILAVLVILLGGYDYGVPLGGLLVLFWARLSHTPWHEIGYVRPKHWIVTILVGIVFGAALKLLMKAIVMPLFGADPINQNYHYLAGNTAALPGAVWAVVVGAGFGEETVFRGFLFQRLAKLFGSHAWTKPLTVLLTAVGFGLAHYTGQGLPGVEQATVVGLVFGSIFAVTGRIWLLMVAHAAFDLMAIALIYWELETRVAHFVFK